MCFLRPSSPHVNVLNEGVILEEVYLAELSIHFKLMYKILQRDHKTIANHTTATHCDVIASFVLLTTYLILVDSFHSHVNELFGLRLFEQCHYLWYR